MLRSLRIQKFITVCPPEYNGKTLHLLGLIKPEPSGFYLEKLERKTGYLRSNDEFIVKNRAL